MSLSLVTGAAAAVAGGSLAASQTASTDFAGIAQIIAATATLVAAIGGLVIALQKKSSAKEMIELARALRGEPEPPDEADDT